MRVLLTVDHADPTADAHAVTLADALVARGHDVFIASEHAHAPTRASRVKVRLGAGSLWRTGKGVLSLVWLIRRNRLQVVDARSPRVRLASWLASRLGGVPLVSVTADATSDADVVCREYAYRSTYVKATRHEIPILCYHRLIERDEEGSEFETHLRVDRFEAQLQYLRDHRFRTLHFADVDNAMVFEKQRRAVVLTFDDGYEDNFRLLFPLLKKYNAKAVIYLVSGLQHNEWDVRRGDAPRRLLNQAERREMLESGLVEFGAHTVTHADLSTVDRERARVEIQHSKTQLESELGVPVQTFAYPYGHLSAEAKELARHAGFRYALATNSGPRAMHEDPFHVRRVVVFPSITMKRFKRKVSGRYVQRPTVCQREAPR